MRKMLVATHGKFADGIMETFQLIMGENESIQTLNAYTEPDFDLQKEVENIVRLLRNDEELIVVADVLGGSVANAFSQYSASSKVHVITGLKLPLLIAVAQELDSAGKTEELIGNAVDTAKDGIVDLNRALEQTINEAEEDL